MPAFDSTRKLDSESYRQLRQRFLSSGEVPDEIWGELQAVVRRLVRRSGLPPSYSPYGVWNDEAAEDVFHNWVEDRLLGKAQIVALTQQALELSHFRGRAERSLRQHLINQRERSVLRNLYRRLRELLEADGRFVKVRASRRHQDVGWALSTQPGAEGFAGSEKELVAAAWSLGEFALVSYRSDAGKLSPVLATVELARFVVGLFEAVGASLTLTQLLRALELRFDLGAVKEEPIESEPQLQSEHSVAETVELRELAIAALTEMTPRQVSVLRDTEAGESLQEMAARYGCSLATVHNEQRRIGALFNRIAGSDDKELLKMVRDLLY